MPTDPKPTDHLPVRRLPIHRLLAVVAGATAVVAAAAPAAQARVLDHDDQTQDVRVASPSRPDTKNAAPRHRDGDVSAVRMSNGNVIGIRVTFVDLRRTGGYRLDLLKVFTNEHVLRNVTISSTTGSDRAEVEVTRADGTEVGCHISHSTDYDANVVAIHVPRWCLGDPRWVRLGYVRVSTTQDGRLSFFDDAQRNHAVALDLAPTMSDRIWRH